MNGDSFDAEKWLYRLVILGGAATWYVTTHSDSVWYWTYRWRDMPLLFCLPPMALALWILVRQPRWPVALAGVGVAVAWLAVLFPIFAKSSVPERQGSCRSNLKQIAIACLQYEQDYDHHLPPMEVRWTEALVSYTRNDQIFRCPGNSQRAANNRRPTPQKDPKHWSPVSYGLNPFLRGRKLTDVPRPAEVILAWCGDAAGPVMRHNGGCNYAYADGHVKWIPADRDPGVWNPWEPAP